jgi:hypothetical protein
MGKLAKKVGGKRNGWIAGSLPLYALIIRLEKIDDMS